MTFKEWLIENKITIKKASEDMGFSTSHFSMVINGKKPTTKFFISCVERYTNGQTNNTNLFVKNPHFVYGQGAVAKLKTCNRYSAYFKKKYIGLFKTAEDARDAINSYKTKESK